MQTKPDDRSFADDSIEAFDLPEELYLENVLERFEQLDPGECLRFVDDAHPAWICSLLEDELREQILVKERGRKIEQNHYVALLIKTRDEVDQTP